ncbi:MAG: hypothetical protein MZV64_39615 [Ignavibacteriales bacterium]|nr:hypothetical protein [Ignavibacteriales bacterium]
MPVNQIYILTILKPKEIINLTNDIFSDFDPSWSHDDKVIYFSSDRGDKLDAKMLPPDFRIHAT